MPSSAYLGLEDERLRSLRGEERRQFFRARLHERDKGICWLCGQPVALADMDLDHVVPRVCGGATHWDNLRAAHRRCNRSRREGQPRRRSIRAIENAHHLVVRFPPDLMIWLRDLAEREDRSVNGQIIHMLREKYGGFPGGTRAPS